MRTLVFMLVVLMGNICYGQIPFTKDKVLILLTGPDTCSLSRDAERHFSNPGVIKFMKGKDIQFIRCFGDDLGYEWRQKNKITHYPAMVYLVKDGDKYSLAKTVSGPEHSKVLGKIDSLQWLLGMKAEIYRVPSNHPLIPGSNTTPRPYVSSPQVSPYIQPQQQMPQQFIGGS